VSAPSSPTSIADVTDPGLAAGPLAMLLRHGRDLLLEEYGSEVLPSAPAARPFHLALLAERAPPLLVLTPRTSDAQAVFDGLAAYLGEDRVALFPPWETLPHERLSPQPATVGRRLAVLDRLVRPAAHPEPLLAVVAPVRAALQPMDPALGERAPLTLTRRLDLGFDGLVEVLAGLGYTRVGQVESRGEFAVRGGIVDVFPTAGDHAVRLEFWGDDVESLRTFGVGDQRSIDAVDEVVVDPARELVIDETLRERARAQARLMPSLAGSLERLAEGVVFEGAESLVTLLHPRPNLLPDFFPRTSGVALVDPMLLRERADKVREEAEVLADVAWELPDGSHLFAEGGFASVEKMLDRVGGPRWDLPAFGDDRLPGQPWDTFKGDVEAIATRTRKLLDDGFRVVVTTVGHGPAKRLRDVLAEQTVPAQLDEEVAAQPVRGRVEIAPSLLRHGFLSEELGLAVLGEWDLFGPRRTRRASRRMGARTSAADAVLELAEGDPVVHRTHGVGIYRGMVTRDITGPNGERVTRDYVKLEYANGDQLFVPSDQVDAVARYQGGEKPAPMRLGGAQWEKAKTRVRSSVRDIAAELIRLYAARMHSPGFAVSPDGMMQRELEDAFQHVETVDQLTVLDEIKRDLETPLPMDRVLAGDVGFGKTEVAVRAAGKVVFDGKQVAVLVPTTILAQQHYETFRERFAGFPVEIRMLSRFVTDAEKRDTLDGIAAGTVDLVVGTHALLAKSVAWRDLGLVVIDEEQRFGVAQKERLKQLRTSVDVLSMSATPIPRTLEMAVSGIRDLSVIETPPEDRQPVMTIVQEYDEGQIALAIRRELLRDGQVFYVHNQVDTIHSVAAHLQELVPDARFRIAHGQMHERELEHVMVGFWEREFDVLVSTTIIESGLDIPNANTLIIERSDLLGLSQLHQLRGRVGRSSERGYAYFLYPEGASITEPAYERLRTISEHARLGSGLAIAMRDLELRGAGNVVGAEQSGQVAAVGFEMYTQLLKEEVADLTGQPIEQEVDITLDLPVDAHLPKDYVEDERQRLELYKRIAAIRDAGGVKRVEEELTDRFGAPPGPARKLLTLAALKAALRRWGITEVVVTPKGQLKVSPVRLSDSQLVRLERLHRHAVVKSDTGILLIPLPRPGPDDVVAWVAGVLRDLFAAPRKGR
jgi:transcription-repair coupling factor (superfamily II helicase)